MTKIEKYFTLSPPFGSKAFEKALNVGEMVFKDAGSWT